MFLISGCGDGESETVSAQEPPNPSSSQSPASLLLDKSDLPPGPVKEEGLPEPCDPVLVLEEQGAEAAGSPLYKLTSKIVGEAVGIAPSEEKATAALEELQTPERLACIKTTIESFGPGEGVEVTIEEPEPIAEGDEGSMVRLLEVDAQSQPVNSTTIVSFRSGRCVATLLFILRDGDAGDAFVENLTSRADRVLADADACR